jgi:hypothetical protein
VLGVWVASAPASVPGLTLPNSPEAARARMRMMHMPRGTRMQPGMKSDRVPGGKMQDGKMKTAP